MMLLSMIIKFILLQTVIIVLFGLIITLVQELIGISIQSLNVNKVVIPVIHGELVSNAKTIIPYLKMVTVQLVMKIVQNVIIYQIVPYVVMVIGPMDFKNVKNVLITVLFVLIIILVIIVLKDSLLILKLNLVNNIVLNLIHTLTSITTISNQMLKMHMTSWSKSELLMLFILVCSRTPIILITPTPTCMKSSSEDGKILSLSLEKEHNQLIQSHTVLHQSVITISNKDTESPITMEKSPFSDSTKNTKKQS